MPEPSPAAASVCPTTARQISPTDHGMPFALVSLTYIAMSAGSTVLIMLVRGPIGEPHWTVPLQTFLLSGAVPLTWNAASRRVLSGEWCSYALALLATVAVLFSPALMWLDGPLWRAVSLPFLAAIWVVGLVSLASGLRDQPFWQSLAALVIGFCLSVIYFHVVNAEGYASVFTPEQTLLGLQHRDTLYHASIAAMLAKYRAVSTGLDGLVFVRTTRWPMLGSG